jgi:hypothetical protein
MKVDDRGSPDDRSIPSASPGNQIILTSGYSSQALIGGSDNRQAMNDDAGLIASCNTRKRRARFTQVEIKRLIVAAKKAGLRYVELRIGGDTYIRLPLAPGEAIADSDDFVL